MLVAFRRRAQENEQKWTSIITFLLNINKPFPLINFIHCLVLSHPRDKDFDKVNTLSGKGTGSLRCLTDKPSGSDLDGFSNSKIYLQMPSGRHIASVGKIREKARPSPRLSMYSLSRYSAANIGVVMEGNLD